MTEYRTERVEPQYENDIVQMLGAFGWVLISSQEVYNENTEVVGVNVKSYNAFMQGFTGKDGKIEVKQRRNITNYTVLKFSRDTGIQDYSRLKALNDEFESKLSVPEPQKPIKRTAITVIGILIIIISIIMAIAESNSAAVWEIIVCVVFPVVMIPITCFAWNSYKKKLRYFNCVQQRLDALFEEALKITA